MVFLLLPFAGLICYQSLDFVHEAWRLGESSVAPMGLCCRWAFKTFIPVGFVLLGMAAFSRGIKAFNYLKCNPKER